MLVEQYNAQFSKHININKVTKNEIEDISEGDLVDIQFDESDIGAFHGYVCDQSYNKFPKLCFIKLIWKSQIWANEHKTFNPILNLHKYASI